MSIEMRVDGVPLPIKVRFVEGRGPVAVETTTVDVPGRHGSYYVKKRYPARPMGVDFIMDVKDVDELNAVLTAGEEVSVTFSDEPGRTYRAYLSGEPDWDEIRTLGLGTLPFVRQPFMDGEEKTVTGTQVVYGGTRETSPTIEVTFTASASEYKITHADGRYVKVIYGFVAGDRLIIDMDKRKVTINDNLRMTSYDWRSKPFVLKPGTNELTVTPGGVTTTKIHYKERWL